MKAHRLNLIYVTKRYDDVAKVTRAILGHLPHPQFQSKLLCYLDMVANASFTKQTTRQQSSPTRRPKDAAGTRRPKDAAGTRRQNRHDLREAVRHPSAGVQRKLPS
jgi:hypothetical protein